MSAEVNYKKTADGWDVHAVECKDVVVRIVGPRITVATIPDDDDTPTPEKPLAVTLA
jgi:hypothetical protein